MARPFLLDLARVTGETVFLSVVEREEVLYIDKVDSTQAIRYIADIGTRRPLHCTSVGKLYLALLPEREALEVALRHGLARFAPATIPSRRGSGASWRRSAREATRPAARSSSKV